MEYDDAEMSSASGSSYQRDLHDEYVKLSKSEFDQGDYADSDKYAEKALALSNGEHVQPEMIATRDLPADKVDELSRSEEHTSELQSLMRISYAVFCLKKKKTTHK